MSNSRKVLIIEGDHDTRVLYRRALEDAGYAVCSATNGRNGIDELRKSPSLIALVLLAINMPIMDGNEFLRIKSADPMLANIPVVVITVQPNSVLYPVSNIIQKPPDLSELIKTVKSVFHD